MRSNYRYNNNNYNNYNNYNYARKIQRVHPKESHTPFDAYSYPAKVRTVNEQIAIHKRIVERQNAIQLQLYMERCQQQEINFHVRQKQNGKYTIEI